MCGLIHELNSAELNQIESNLNEIERNEANLDRARRRRRDGGSQVATEKKNKDTKKQSKKKKKKGKKRANTDVRTRDWTNYHSRAAQFSHAQRSVTIAA